MSTPDLTALLHAWSEGDLAAREQLMPLVYEELRRRAAWQNRAQFFAVAAEIMRRILVDWARAHATAKRSGQWSRVTLDPPVAVTHPPDVDVLDLDIALRELAALDPRKSKIAELRFFAGLSLEEIGELLQLSAKTVERDWQVARAWLFKALSAPAPASHEAAADDA